MRKQLRPTLLVGRRGSSTYRGSNQKLAAPVWGGGRGEGEVKDKGACEGEGKVTCRGEGKGACEGEGKGAVKGKGEGHEEWRVELDVGSTSCGLLGLTPSVSRCDGRGCPHRTV